METLPPTMVGKAPAEICSCVKDVGISTFETFIWRMVLQESPCSCLENDHPMFAPVADDQFDTDTAALKSLW